MRRNISWPESTDELARHMALHRDMPVSTMLELLVEDEAKHDRIKPGSGSSLLQMFRDEVSVILEKAGYSLDQAGGELQQKAEKIKKGTGR